VRRLIWNRPTSRWNLIGGECSMISVRY
jgi:hypothetical protein